MAGKIVPNDQLFAWTSLQPGKEQLHKPILIEEHVNPAILAAVVSWAVQLPPSV